VIRKYFSDFSGSGSGTCLFLKNNGPVGAGLFGTDATNRDVIEPAKVFMSE
jgi:hypothetical protein